MIKYNLIRDTDSFYNELAKINLGDTLFMDTETCWSQGNTDNSKTKTGGLYGDVRLVQFYTKHMDRAVLVDCMFVDMKLVMNKLRKFHQVWHNSSYDLHTINLVYDEPYLPPKFDDTFYLSKLALFEVGVRYGFHECLKYIGEYDQVIASLDKKENQKSDWGNELTDTQLRYAASDVIYLEKLYKKVKKAKETNSYKLDIESMRQAVKYSRNGIPISKKAHTKIKLETMNAYEEVMAKLPVNPNSPKQVCEWLGTPKSDKDTLVAEYLHGNENAKLVTDARSLSKLLMFLRKYDREEIKGFYNPCGALSGRFTCTGGDRYDHENLQQIPGKLLQVFEAPEGYSFIYNDYSGVELKMAVAWIAEPTMLKLMLAGKDLHTETAAFIYDKKAEQVTKEERTVGKICNFLLIYGGWPQTLRATMMQWAGIVKSLEEVKAIHSKWFEMYPYFKEWQDMTSRMLSVYGYVDVTTALGRTVRCTKLTDAVNVPIQGSCAEVNKTAIVLLHTRYPETKLISTIHDSNTLLQKTKEKSMWIDRLNECMLEAWYYVIKDTAVPDLPMPAEAQANTIWEFD